METDKTPSLLEATIESTEIVGKYSVAYGLVSICVVGVAKLLDMDDPSMTDALRLTAVSAGTYAVGNISSQLYGMYQYAIRS